MKNNSEIESEKKTWETPSMMDLDVQSTSKDPLETEIDNTYTHSGGS